MQKIVTFLAAIMVAFTAFLIWPQKDQSEGFGDAEAPDRKETASTDTKPDESPEPEPVEPEPFELTLIHTNDTHTVMDNIARRASLIEDIRETSTHHLLLSAGDVTSWEIGRKAQDSLANAVFMNHLDYDGMVLGNHEFDLGEGVVDHGPLSTYVEHAAHPVLGANVDFSQDQFLEPYADYSYTEEPVDGRINKGFVQTVGDEKIGIFGITHYKEVVTVPGDVSFADYTEAAKDAVAHFESIGIDKIVALTHIGVGHDRTLAKEVPGIDVIIGGHSHVTTNPPNQIGDTLVVQTGEYDTNLGELNVVFDEAGKIVDHSGKLHPTKNAEIHPDTARVQELFDEATALGIVSYEDFIGHVIKAGELDTYETFIK
ncbi:bifunctional metallophosphatase/5'-nucleotidase [Planococcus rifietoensis]|uniref:bifunctional metallophosphatase/5'-nucleotidase n=1 Tax=Planococcus rifietoensis TaxID=200991 RepID=UPI00384ECF4B